MISGTPCLWIAASSASTQASAPRLLDLAPSQNSAACPVQLRLPKQWAACVADQSSFCARIVAATERAGQKACPRPDRGSLSKANWPLLACSNLMSGPCSRLSAALANTSAARRKRSAFHYVIWFGCTSKRAPSCANVWSPLTAAIATFALNTAVCLRRGESAYRPSPGFHHLACSTPGNLHRSLTIDAPVPPHQAPAPVRPAADGG